MAGQRLESVEDQFEEFFDVNAVDDVEDDFHKQSDFYNRRDSKTQPNQRTQCMADLVKEEEFLNNKLKPQLQELIENIKIEERSKGPKSAVGECVTYFMEEKILSEIQGMAMANRPHGLLFLAIKFSMYIVKLVKTTDLLVLSENHQALF